MLKPKQHDFYFYEHLVQRANFLPEQRRVTFSTMDSSRRLVQVIMEMQLEIKKLESENRALRGGVDPAGHSGSQEAKAEDHASPTNLRRNVSAPALEGPFKENVIMTVRRYSVSSTARSNAKKKDNLTNVLEEVEPIETSKDRLREGNNGDETPVLGSMLLDQRDQGSARPPSNLLKEQINNRRSLKDYVHKNRAKVKSVSFLLPVEHSHCTDNNQSSQKYIPNQNDLGITVGKDL